jgi:hypothetical protein
VSNTELIAGLAGPLLVAVALAMLVNRQVLRAIAADVGRNPSFIFFAGMLTLLAGLAIVRSHNIWTADWKGLVTLIGWLAVIAGFARIIVPDRVAEVHTRVTSNDMAFAVWAFVALLLGLYLSAKAYLVIT